MIVCGIELSGSEAKLAVLEGTKDDFIWKDIKPKKMGLPDDENSAEVRAFRDSIFAFLRENQIDVIAIKKRNKRGEFSGGPISFKLEGIIQLYEDCSIKLLAPITISNINKKRSPQKPVELNKYQYSAFETAFCALP
jgi:hypothetical protein